MSKTDLYNYVGSFKKYENNIKKNANKDTDLQDSCFDNEVYGRSCVWFADNESWNGSNDMDVVNELDLLFI